jgi:hypothetical protein
MCHKPARVTTTMNEVATGSTSGVDERLEKLMAVMAAVEALRIVELRPILLLVRPIVSNRFQAGGDHEVRP